MANKKDPVPPPPVPLELWRDLYHAATRLQLLAPWQWMSDSHVFGVNNEHGTRMVSILGALGEVFGMVTYRGSTGANFLLRLLTGQFAPEDPDGIFCQDALLANFVPLTRLDKPDRNVIQQIGFKAAFSRPKLYPKFKSHKPGYVPWFIDEAEARLLLDDLNNAARFAELLRRIPDLYDSHGMPEFPFITATGTGPLSAGQLEWHAIFADPPPPDPAVNPQEFDLAPLMKLPQVARTQWELTAFYSDMRIGEPPRPFYPKISMGVESSTGIVVGVRTCGTEHTMAQTAALGLLQSIQAAQCRPEVVKSDSPLLIQALQPIAAALGLRIAHAKSLPMAADARRSLEAFGRQK